MPPATESSRGAPRSAGDSRALDRLLDQAGTLQSLAGEPDESLRARSEAVSAWSVGQQLEHMGLVGLWVVGAVDELAGRPEEPAGGSPTVPGWVHLATGWIPRGRVRAADAIRPRGDDPASARQAVDRYSGGLSGLPPRLGDLTAARGTRPHPVLGHFTARRWLRFLFHHQRHHLEIVGEIRQAAGPRHSERGTA